MFCEHGKRHKVLIESYPDSADRRKWGGIETANLNLSRTLTAGGAGVVSYSVQNCPTVDSVAALARIEAADAVLPLVESDLFRSPMQAPAWLLQRTVRVWHDVSALAPRFSTLMRCSAHRPGINPAACQAASVAPAACSADVFFYEEPWTYCFPNRLYIPWAADHVPANDYHDPEGPVVLLAGKVPTDVLLSVVDGCLSRGLRMRVVFNNWSRLGQDAKVHFANLEQDGNHQFFWVYELERDHARIFSGVSAALVLSHHHETFNFLAAEAVQLGVPVVAFARSGATRRFAAQLVEDGAALLSWFDRGGLAVLKPTPRPNWSWQDVGTAYSKLLRGLDARKAIS